ncbi:MAG: hypothetical protein RIK87_13055 [Fuerstiella sp.]
MHAGYEEGEFVTKPFRFSGTELEINYSTSGAGRMRIELQQADGQPIAGYSLADCDVIYGDDIARVVRWKNGADLKDVAGTPVRLRFVMNEADVFSLKFNEATPLQDD